MRRKRQALMHTSWAYSNLLTFAFSMANRDDLRQCAGEGGSTFHRKQQGLNSGTQPRIEERLRTLPFLHQIAA
jgi:hypothetical protein